ncbi:scavenger receptor cysteine-rich type 1 protein M130-like, partial [Carassius auratus]|uniref:Scavenger receptor cysteine-rich type 1 protein M130-like n=1 Tax=Carassius auratus TaxID=7957 RepID=A0A6P6MYH5_CARAU
LVGSGGDCAGRLEVFHSGSWGTVCDDSWDIKDAHVVCRQLQCGVALSNQQVPAWFGPGSGHIWLDEVECEGNETSLWSCSSPGWGKHDCQHKKDVGVICSEFKEIRLTEGCEGNLEVFYNGSWGNVCYNQMNRNTASLICQDLNCGRSGSEPSYSEGQKPHNWLDNLKCRRHDSTLWQCPSSAWGQNDCDNDEVAKITCSEDQISESPQSFLTCSTSPSPYKRQCSDHVPLRLSEGDGRCGDMAEGKCQFIDFPTDHQTMLKKQATFMKIVGFSGVVGDVNGTPVHIIAPTGTEVIVNVRLVNGDSRCAGRVEVLHDDSVNVRLVNGDSRCAGRVEVLHDGYTDLRLVNGPDICSGRVERQYFSKWGTLGCGSVLNFYSSSSSSPEHSHECVTGFQCSGSEAHLGNCSSPRTLSCSSTQQLSITCIGRGSIRLVGSGGDCAGRLEVFHNGSWGTVCDDSWDIKDAHVVCRQLQCGVALSNQPVPAWFGPGSGPIWLDEVECEGNETSLWSCSSPGWGKHDCQHKKDVGVVCSEFKEIRLTEGCEGNVEVFYNGSWGNVCWNQMDRDTASLICQELNCGRSGNEPSYSEGLKPRNWLDNLKCRRHDSTLWQCPSSAWGKYDCDNEVAKITCSKDQISESPQSFLTCSTSPSSYKRQCSNHVPLRLSGGDGRC